MVHRRLLHDDKFGVTGSLLHHFVRVCRFASFRLS